MTEKSYVGMGYHLCPVCGLRHDEVVLLSKRLKDELERDNFVDWKLCPEHEAMREEYIALVECKNAHDGETLKPEYAVRTGNIAHVRRSVADRIFNVELSPTLPLVFVEIGVIDKLKAMQHE